jgi:hypothetical protein
LDAPAASDADRWWPVVPNGARRHGPSQRPGVRYGWPITDAVATSSSNSAIEASPLTA